MNHLQLMFDFIRNPTFALPFVAIISYRLFKFFRRKIYAEQEARKMYLNDDNEFKLVLVVRTDLKMSRGKAATQCAHAAVGAYKLAEKRCPEFLNAWEECGQAKVALKCSTEAELVDLNTVAREVGLVSNIVHDAGRTQVPSGSKTVCGIGPGPVEVIDQITGHLKLY